MIFPVGTKEKRVKVGTKEKRVKVGTKRDERGRKAYKASWY
jgi:hypothetical protein